MGEAASDPAVTPQLSIIVPAYNAQATIGTALTSALEQTGPPVEVIVVDDGSTDRTTEIVSSISDPRIRLLRQANAGPSAARNRGIAASRASWLGLLDATTNGLLAAPRRC